MRVALVFLQFLISPILLLIFMKFEISFPVNSPLVAIEIFPRLIMVSRSILNYSDESRSNLYVLAYANTCLTGGAICILSVAASISSVLKSAAKKASSGDLALKDWTATLGKFLVVMALIEIALLYAVLYSSGIIATTPGISMQRAIAGEYAGLVFFSAALFLTSYTLLTGLAHLAALQFMRTGDI